MQSTTDDEPLIDADDVSKVVATGAGELCILRGITLAIKAGEAVAITGASGSGKSTLLGLLAGLDVPSSGSIRLGGHVLTALDEDRRAAVRAELVGFVFQSFQLLPTLTALENVMLPLELQGRRDAQTAATEYLDRVGLGARCNHYPRQLSGGEQQRVAIARAFAGEPKVLFADEPTGNLDSVTGAHIIDLLFAMNRAAGTTLILVTHEQRLADRCGRRIILDSGAVIADSARAGAAQSATAMARERD